MPPSHLESHLLPTGLRYEVLRGHESLFVQIITLHTPQKGVQLLANRFCNCMLIVPNKQHRSRPSLDLRFSHPNAFVDTNNRSEEHEKMEKAPAKGVADGYHHLTGYFSDQGPPCTAS